MCQVQGAGDNNEKMCSLLCLWYCQGTNVLTEVLTATCQEDLHGQISLWDAFDVIQITRVHLVSLSMALMSKGYTSEQSLTQQTLTQQTKTSHAFFWVRTWDNVWNNKHPKVQLLKMGINSYSKYVMDVLKVTCHWGDSLLYYSCWAALCMGHTSWFALSLYLRLWVVVCTPFNIFFLPLL